MLFEPWIANLVAFLNTFSAFWIIKNLHKLKIVIFYKIAWLLWIIQKLNYIVLIQIDHKRIIGKFFDKRVVEIKINAVHIVNHLTSIHNAPIKVSNKIWVDSNVKNAQIILRNVHFWDVVRPVRKQDDGGRWLALWRVWAPEQKLQFVSWCLLKVVAILSRRHIWEAF